MTGALAYLSDKSEVQCGHFTAVKGIYSQQYGHFLIVGAAAYSFIIFSCSLFTALIKTNTANATITKLITLFKKIP